MVNCGGWSCASVAQVAEGASQACRVNTFSLQSLGDETCARRTGIDAFEVFDAYSTC
jgi:hypothetical protein